MSVNQFHFKQAKDPYLDLEPLSKPGLISLQILPFEFKGRKISHR